MATMPVCVAAILPWRSIRTVTGMAVTLKLFCGGVVADDDRVGDWLFLQVGADGGPAVGVHGDADGVEACVFVFAVEILEPRDFDLAPAAPRCPEIHQDNFSLFFGEADGFAVLGRSA